MFLQSSVMTLGWGCLFPFCLLELEMDTGVPGVPPSCPQICLTFYGRKYRGSCGVRIHMDSFSLLVHWGWYLQIPQLESWV